MAGIGTAARPPARGPARPGGLSELAAAALCGALLAAGCAVPDPVPDLPDLGPEATRGRVIYTEYCASCHGHGGHKLDTAPLAQPFLLQRPDVALAQVVAVGRGEMGGFGRPAGGPLSEAEIAAVLAYVKALAAHSVRR